MRISNSSPLMDEIWKIILDGKWTQEELKEIRLFLSDKIKAKHVEDLGDGIKFIGLSADGSCYMYTKMVDGKKQTYPVDPAVWPFTKKIFEHALSIDDKREYGLKRLQLATERSKL